jgi:hypothetical protein
MSTNTKPIEWLKVADLEANPVWQYTSDDRTGDTLVRPIKRVPVKSLTGKVIGTQVRFANGRQAWALIGNVDPQNPRLTEHFLTVSIERDGKWFALARYHDFDYADRGPEALARFLGLPIDEVFPISFDLRQYAQGDPAALAGSVPKEPRERLSRAEIIALAVP